MSNVIRVSARSKHLKPALQPPRQLIKELKASDKQIHYLNIGDPNVFDFDIPTYLKKRAAEVALEGSGHYSGPFGDEDLREAIVKREKKKNNLDLTIDDVIVTLGISEAIKVLFGALIDPGDEILVPGPTFPPYRDRIKYFGGKPVAYRTIEENGWNPDVDDLREKITDRTRAIVIINPNNPTGAVYPRNILEEMVGAAEEKELFIISDEVYDDLVYGETPYIGVSSLTKNVPVIGFNGFSKVYSACGWRVGYMSFHDPTNRLRDLKNTIIDDLGERLSACTLTMKACAVAFSGPQNHIKEMTEKLKKRAEFYHKRFKEMPGIEAQKPEGAFYIFPSYPGGVWKTDYEFRDDVLKNTGIVFAPGNGFCPIYGDHHFRSVTLPPIGMMEEPLNKLEKFMYSRL